MQKTLELYFAVCSRDPTMYAIGSKQVFKPKLQRDETLDRLKARLVAKRYHQINDVDYIDIFPHVIKLGTTRLVLNIALF